MVYKVVFRDEARKAFERLDRAVREQVVISSSPVVAVSPSISAPADKQQPPDVPSVRRRYFGTYTA